MPIINKIWNKNIRDKVIAGTYLIIIGFFIKNLLTTISLADFKNSYKNILNFMTTEIEIQVWLIFTLLLISFIYIIIIPFFVPLYKILFKKGIKRNSHFKSYENFKNPRDIKKTDIKLKKHNDLVNSDETEEISGEHQKLKKILLEKIKNYNNFNYELKHNTSYAVKNNFDFILSAYETKKFHDIIIKIIYLKDKLTMNDIRALYQRNIHNKYKTDLKREARVVLFVIYNKNKQKSEELNRFINANKEFIKDMPIGQFKHYLIAEEEINNFDIKRIFNIVDKELI